MRGNKKEGITPLPSVAPGSHIGSHGSFRMCSYHISSAFSRG
jgi:hypothetical protein